MKKNQHKEDIIKITINNFGSDWWSLRYLNKIKTVTQAVCMIMGKCFWGCWQPIRCQLFKNIGSADQSKITHNHAQTFFKPKNDLKCL